MNTKEQKRPIDQSQKTVRRKKKMAPPTYENRQRLVIDKKCTPKTHALAIKLLTSANKKEHGRPITFNHLIALALSKINTADINRLKSESLTDMDKVNLKLTEYNNQNKTNLSLGQFLVRELLIETKPQQKEEQP